MKEPKIKTYEQARHALLDMQSQIIHGSNCFAEIAEVMRQLKEETVGRTSGTVGYERNTENDELRHKLTCQQQLISDAHRLFHEPLENAPEIDWATIHGSEDDNPAGFVRILRKQLSESRAEVEKLKEWKESALAEGKAVQS